LSDHCLRGVIHGVAHWTGKLCLLVLCLPMLVLAATPSVAFYYGAQAPLADLQAFDIAVVEPDFVSNPASHTRSAADGAHELFAYVSLGEVQPTRSYYQALPAGALRGDNAAWGSNSKPRLRISRASG
jgi:hypothetical protein